MKPIDFLFLLIPLISGKNTEFLTRVSYENRNVSVYAAITNHARDPKTWVFFYDPSVMLPVNEKWLVSYNNEVRVNINFGNSELDHLTRTAIVSSLHPDINKFALFWTINPLSIDILTAYITDEFNDLLPGVFPCYKTYVNTANSLLCHFECASMLIATKVIEKLLCGKYTIKFFFQIDVELVGNRLSNFQLKMFAKKHIDNKRYIHRSQMSKFVANYFVNVQSLDDTISEKQLQLLFEQAMTTTERLKLDVQLYKKKLEIDVFQNQIIITNLLIISNLVLIECYNSCVLFHLRNQHDSYLSINTTRRTFCLKDIQTIFEKKDLEIEWSRKQQWIIKAFYVHKLLDILDVLQLALITNLFRQDESNAISIHTVNCINWSKKCPCQSDRPALVFYGTGIQRVLICTNRLNIHVDDITIEIRIRPDELPLQVTQVFDLLGIFVISYLSDGKVTFTVGGSLPVISLVPIELDKWTHIAGVFYSTQKLVQLFINGQLASTVTLDKPPFFRNMFNGYLAIGNNHKTTILQGFIGALCDVRIWNCIRSPNEILFNMNVSLIGNETCLTGYWPLSDGKGQIVYDLTRFRNIGTLGIDSNPGSDDPTWSVVLPPSVLAQHTIKTNNFTSNLSLPIIFQWGLPADVPVTGDYDGDGLSDFAIWRPSTLTWYITPSTNPLVILTRTWGLPGDVPFEKIRGVIDHFKARLIAHFIHI
ncbi:unnamed protein product [Didymodactylos carnosus]|uniref:LamG-like jellyroll fold domain-containing protein n=1 Tax=Didymodactylos carnosus TaxID=1234261 RepID=A0A8S2JFK2_9BILA|nr:unnamed protein product [Didymodactylos carnosus]CAF3807412.1 unnamed protein product [Didymodactylos carnosus]